jgi:hypothetical protein
MRRQMTLAGWALGLMLAASTTSHAQFFNGNGATNDPFTLYYGWFLPQQAALSVRQAYGPSATINALSAARQEAAYTDRASLFDPVAKYGLDYQYDPSNPFPDRRQGTRPGGLAAAGSNINGSGPGPYYNRVTQYFPGARVGRGPNASVRGPGAFSGGGSRGGFGMPSVGPRSPAAGLSPRRGF